MKPSAGDSVLTPAAPMIQPQIPQPSPHSQASRPHSHARQRKWAGAPGPAGAGTTVTAPFKEIQLGDKELQ